MKDLAAQSFGRFLITFALALIALFDSAIIAQQLKPVGIAGLFILGFFMLLNVLFIYTFSQTYYMFYFLGWSLAIFLPLFGMGIVSRGPFPNGLDFLILILVLYIVCNIISLICFFYVLAQLTEFQILPDFLIKHKYLRSLLFAGMIFLYIVMTFYVASFNYSSSIIQSIVSLMHSFIVCYCSIFCLKKLS